MLYMYFIHYAEGSLLPFLVIDRSFPPSFFLSSFLSPLPYRSKRLTITNLLLKELSSWLVDGLDIFLVVRKPSSLLVKFYWRK